MCTIHQKYLFNIICSQIKSYDTEKKVRKHYNNFFVPWTLFRNQTLYLSNFVIKLQR